MMLTRLLRPSKRRAVTVLALAVGATTIANESSAKPSLALRVTPTGLIASSCSRKQPCRTLQRAYDVASPGTTVDVDPGTYPPQSVAGTKAGPRVVMKLAAGAHFVDLSIDADNLEIRGGKIDDLSVNGDSSGFVSRDTDRGVFGVFGADNASFIGGDAGPEFTAGSPLKKIWIQFSVHPPYKEPTRILIDHVRIHDFRRGDAEDHPECIFIVGGNGITIRNSTFLRCDLFSIFAGTPWFGSGLPPMRNVTIENNVFGASTLDGRDACVDGSCASYAIRFADDWPRFENFRIDFNSMLMGLSLGADSIPKQNFIIDSNVLPFDGCVDGIIYLYNVFQSSRGERCGPTDKRIRGRADYDQLGFTDPAATNLKPTTRSPAVNAGNPKIFPASDMFGRHRPLGGRPDAGAIEVR